MTEIGCLLALLDEFVPCHAHADSSLSPTLSSHFPELLYTPGWSWLCAKTEGNIVWFRARAGAGQCFGQTTPKHALYLKALPGARLSIRINCVAMMAEFRIYSMWILGVLGS